MTKKLKAQNAAQLAKILRLSPADAVQLEFRAQLNAKIIKTVQRKGLTHTELATLSNASRTRITAILNGNTAGISTDLLLRILYALGYKVRAVFTASKLAA